MIDNSFRRIALAQGLLNPGLAGRDPAPDPPPPADQGDHPAPAGEPAPALASALAPARD